jgi:PAS domain S-box-containing protein
LENLELSKEELMAKVSQLSAEVESLKQNVARRDKKIKTLRESWKRVARVFEDAPIGLVLLSAKGRVTDANKAGRKMLFAEGGKLKSSKFISFFYERSDGGQFFKQLRRDGFVADMETKLKNADGTARNIFLQADVAPFGETGEACVALYDLTNIRQMQGHMPELYRDGQLLFAQIPIGMLLTDQKESAGFQAVAETMGYSLEEIKKINILSLYVDQLTRLQLLEMTVRKGSVRDFEVDMYRKDGSVMTALLGTDLIESEDGKKIFLTSVRDISEYRKVWDDLRLELNITRAVRDTTPALIVVLDVEGTIIRFSRVFESATGFLSAEVTGKKIWEVFPADPAFSREAVLERFEKKITGSEENTLTTKNGKMLTVLWSYTMVRDQDGGIKYILASGNDITKRRVAEAGLRTANDKLRAWVDELELRSRDTSQITEMGEQLQSCENAWEACAIGATVCAHDLPGEQGRNLSHQLLPQPCRSGRNLGHAARHGTRLPAARLLGLAARARLSVRRPWQGSALRAYHRPGGIAVSVRPDDWKRGDAGSAVHEQGDGKRGRARGRTGNLPDQ